MSYQDLGGQATGNKIAGAFRKLFAWVPVIAGIDSSGQARAFGVDSSGNLLVAQGASPAGVQETVSMTRPTSSASVALGKRSITFVCSKESPVIGNGVDFAGSIGGITRQPGESITVRAQAGNTLSAVAYTITGGGSIDIITTA